MLFGLLVRSMIWGLSSLVKIALLISGGVDSSVALAKLASSGEHEIVAFYLKIWLEDDLAFLGECPWEDDLNYARAVCEKYNVPLKVVSLQTAYWDLVVKHIIEELKKGLTPSPDILCNQRVKYGAFTDFIDDSYDKIASGHYAQVKETPQGFVLAKGVDPIKDQTYFLSHLSQKQLSRCLFPLGSLQKRDVRTLAETYDLPNKARRDSQGICFLGKIKYNDFVKCHLGEKPGVIQERSTGKVLGKHKGYWYHTVGQRRGLGLHGGPWFVSGKDVKRNIVYVDHNEVLKTAHRSSFTLDTIHWVSSACQEGLSVKIRHGERTVGCQISGDGPFEVHMEESDAGVAPGQYAVLYKGEECLGGGVIAH